jgi:arylsulfatase A-like enzyme
VRCSDDLGFSDVSMHGSSQIPTPNLAALADNGAMLGSYCAPTPAAASLHAALQLAAALCRRAAIRRFEP